jgi:serine/threonine-protein kinase RsbW
MNRETTEMTEISTGLSEPVSLRLPSQPEYVLLARLLASRMGQLARFSEEDVYDLKLAVTEAATNVVRHASVEAFDIEYRVAPGLVEITVVDLGGGFEVEQLTRSPDEWGGFGLAVIRSLVDEMVLEKPQEGGTRLRMVRRASDGKKSPPPHGPPHGKRGEKS